MRKRWLIPILLGATALGCPSRPASQAAEATADAAGHTDVQPPGPRPSAGAENGNPPVLPDGEAAAWPELREVGVGYDYNCALTADRAVYCWGGSSRGQLGIGGWDPRTQAVRVHGLDDAIDLAVGFAHACAVRRDGRVACWGSNVGATLGDGTTTDRTLPVEVLDIDDAVEVAAGLDVSCARRRSGAVACWGRSLGRRPTDPGPERNHLPRPVEGLDDAVGLAAGILHACATLRDGHAACWGANLWDAVGPDDGNWNDPKPFRLPFEQVRQVAAADRHTCVLLEGGEVRCWGSNHGLQLNHFDERAVIPAVRARTPPGLGPARAVAAGSGRTCAVLVDGTVTCWGAGREAALPITGLPPTTQVALQPAADGHACALTTANELWCWGRNDQGQLGDGSRTDSDAPVRVLPPASTVATPVTVEPPTGMPFEADELAVGYDQTCARRGGEVWCWGRPTAAPSNPASPRTRRPARLPGLDDAVQLAAGFGFFCARREQGNVACWGENASGQLGDGTTASRSTPTPVAGLDRVVDLVADYGRACALRSDGQVWCWGGEERAPAGPVEALRSRTGRIRQVALSDDHWCVLLASGEVRCQGHNANGQIGNGEGGCRPDPEGIPCGPPDSACLPPEICAEAPEFAAVRELAPAVELALGSAFSCARHEGGAVSCWGRNHQGQLGRGDGFADAEGWLPAPVADLGDAVRLRADAGRACAVKSDGTAVCWGQNVFGELGDRTTQTSPAPSLVHGLTDVVELGAGQSHTCARTADRRVSCWGDNNYGQLGDGSLERRPAPVLVRTE